MSNTQPPEIIEVDAHTESVGCDGGGGALGHPMVYYSFGTQDAVVCGYCGRRFVKRRAVAEPAPAAQPEQPAAVDPEPEDSAAVAD